ncbi:MAG: hypothetical protein HYS98_06250 [Deltaproteobacteria bacterium]|nr:hypothetical protein [Deltaproteobacteria bacterium]
MNIKSGTGEDRWSTSQKPLLGGILFWLTTLAIALASSEFSKPLIYILISSSLIFFIGLWDDLKNLNPHLKFVFQLICASLLVKGGFITHFDIPNLFNFIISIFWIVFITNSFNLLDNMDGLLGGISFFVFLTFFYFWHEHSIIAYDRISLGLVASLLVFLIYNFPPSKIFMGDTGSLYLGFIASAFTLGTGEIAEKSQTLSILTPSLIVVVPLLDTSFVIFTRLLRKISIFQGGRDHLSHRLLRLGLSEKTTLFFLYTVTLFGCVLALLSRALSPSVLTIFFLMIIVFFFYIASFLYSSLDHKPSPILFLRKFQDMTSLSLRGVAEILCDVVVIGCSFYLAAYLHYEGSFTKSQVSFIYVFLPITIVFRLCAYIFVGTYKSIWRFIGFSDALILLKGCFLGSIFIFTLFFFRYEEQYLDFSSYVFFVEFFISFLTTVGVRSSWKIFQNTLRRFQKAPTNIVIIGTSDQAIGALKELEGQTNQTVIGFITPDETMPKGLKIQGVPIVSSMRAFRQSLLKLNVQEVLWVDDFTNSSHNYDRLRSFCMEQNIHLKRYESHFLEP